MPSKRNAPKFQRDKRTPAGLYYRVRADGKKTWYIRYTDGRGKRVWSACDSFEHAKKRLAEVTTSGPAVGDPTATLSSLLPGWQAQRVAKGIKPRSRESEERNVRLYIEPRWGRMKIRDIHPTDIVTWVGGLKKQNGEAMDDGTKAVVLAHFSSILNYAVNRTVVSSNAVKAIDSEDKPKQGERVKRPLREGELEALLAGVGGQTWLGPILRLLACTGLRLGEVVGLQWGDVDFAAGTITVQRQAGASKGTPKSGKPRTIDMLGPARAILVAQHKIVAAQRLALGLGGITFDTPVFTNSTGGQRQSRDVQRAFAWARDRAGLSTEPRALTLHDFRATVGTRLMLAGIPSPDVCGFMGHSSIAVTEKYYLDKSQKSRTWKERASAAVAS
jgi:integrase